MTHEEMETAIARLFEGQDLLTGKVVELAEEVSELSNALKITREEGEADRKAQRKAMQEMREQAEAHRAEMRDAIGEMREAVGRMIEIAESMESNVVLLTQCRRAQDNVSTSWKSGLIKIEKGTRRGKNGPKR